MDRIPDEPAPVIIIKRIKKVRGHAHHGGAWKIAYADFVTAMMAFFLMMWLLAMTDDAKRRGISDYFENPLRVQASGGQSVGDQASLLQAGGEDFRFEEGEAVRGTPGESTAEALERAREIEELERLKAEIEAAMEMIPSLLKFKGQLLLDLTSDGLRLQIVDKENRPMFASGSAELKPEAQLLLTEVSNLLADSGKRISISGHTDATPFAGGYAGYSNWELSNDRANAARRALVRGGLDPQKVMRVVGLASTVLLDREQPHSPVNRRISIVIMNQEAEEAIQRDGALDGEGSEPAERRDPTG
ncbi:flagellar motor protein MotB [Wenzhouxiangella sp. XN24]|nr:flagellar motor protein MotB [Wenzhouxiangella sp. XN24]